MKCLRNPHYTGVPQTPEQYRAERAARSLDDLFIAKPDTELLSLEYASGVLGVDTDTLALQAVVVEC